MSCTAGPRQRCLSTTRKARSSLSLPKQGQTGVLVHSLHKESHKTGKILHSSRRQELKDTHRLLQCSQRDYKHYWQGYIAINQFNPFAIPVIYYALSIQGQQAIQSVTDKTFRWQDYSGNPLCESDEKVEHNTRLLEQIDNLGLDFQMPALRILKCCTALYLRNKFKHLN